MAKEQFVRDKPHCNVGTIGHIDHGKTTTTGALLAVQAAKGLAQFKSYADIAKGGTVRDATKTVTIAVSHVEYSTEKRHYAHIDCPGHARQCRIPVARPPVAVHETAPTLSEELRFQRAHARSVVHVPCSGVAKGVCQPKISS